MVRSSKAAVSSEHRCQHAGKDLAAFIEANEIVHVRIADLPRHHSWSQFVRQNGIPTVNYERGLVFDTAVLAMQYVLSGQGIALETPICSPMRSGQAAWSNLSMRRWMTVMVTTSSRIPKLWATRRLRCSDPG